MPDQRQQRTIENKNKNNQEQPPQRSRLAFFVFLLSIFLPALLPLTALLVEIHYPEFHSPLNLKNRIVRGSTMNEKHVNDFCNFDRLHCCNGTVKTLKPRTVEEVQQIVAEEFDAMRKVGGRQSAAATPLIRVIGAGHSMSPIVCTSPDTEYPPRDTILMSLDDLGRTTTTSIEGEKENNNNNDDGRVKIIKTFSPSPTNVKKSKTNSPTYLPPEQPSALVWANAGLRLKQLNDRLWDLGYGLYNTGMIQEQSIGGVIATAVHGTGYFNQPINQRVVEIDVVLANGTLAKFSREQHPNIFRHARMHLGLFGVVVGVTFEVRDRFYVLRTERLLNEAAMVDSVLLSSDAIREREKIVGFETGNDNDDEVSRVLEQQETLTRTRSQAWWFQNDKALVQDMSREFSFEQVQNSEHLQSLLRTPTWIRKAEAIVTDTFYLILTTLSVHVPFLTPIIHKLAVLNHSPDRTFLMKSYEAFTHPGISYHSVRYSETEIFVPVEEAKKAFDVYKKFIEEHTRTSSKCNINSVNPLRTVAADDIPLSPSFSSSLISTNKTSTKENPIAFTTFSFTMVYRDSFQDCSTMLQQKLSSSPFGGRMHWGKWFSPKILKFRKDVERMYGSSAVEEFAEAVKSVDPYGLFRPMFFENMFFE